jgi:protein-disulfide isomerase
MAKKSSQPSGNSRQAKIQAAANQNAGAGVNKILVAAVVAILAIVSTVGFVVWNANKQSESVSKSVPAQAAGMGEGFVANKSVTLVPNAPTLDIYEDFQCPACGVFEHGLGSTISELADAGKLKLVYHFKTIIDANFGVDHSLRASNAAMCVAEDGKFEAFHASVYANQPQQEGAGWSEATLQQFAEQAGVTGAALDTYKQCVKDQKYDNYIKSTEAASAKKGINGTPQIQINGKTAKLSDFVTADGKAFDGAKFAKAIEDASK